MWPLTRFVLASVTKTYTATMIMQLVQRGRLSLGTKLARFYPRMPKARLITVRMLLNHTSGLPDYLNEPSFDRAAKNPRHRWNRDVLLAGVHGSDFRPGVRPSGLAMPLRNAVSTLTPPALTRIPPSAM